MRAYEFLFEDIWQDIAKHWSENDANASIVAIDDAIHTFKLLRDRNSLRYPENDILYWKGKSFDEFYDFIKQKATNATKTKGATRTKIKQSKNLLVLDDTADWIAVVPLDMPTSQNLGGDTHWCTSTRAGNNYFDHYVRRKCSTLIYVIGKNEDYKYAIAFNDFNGEIKEIKNKKNDNAHINPKTNILFADISPKSLIQKCMHSDQWKRFANSAIEEIVYEKTRSPDEAYYFAKGCVHGRFPEGEAIISTSAPYSQKYAEYVISGRFPEGESAISQDPSSAYSYARNVIKGKWPEGEDAISQNAGTSCRYAMFVLGGRFPEGEDTISTSDIYKKEYNEFLQSAGIPFQL